MKVIKGSQTDVRIELPEEAVWSLIDKTEGRGRSYDITISEKSARELLDVLKKTLI